MTADDDYEEPPMRFNVGLQQYVPDLPGEDADDLPVRENKVAGWLMVLYVVLPVLLVFLFLLLLIFL